MSEPTPQPAPQAQQFKVPIPQVSLNDVEGFAKVWNKGGITIILDKTAKEFARDFANIVLKSYVLDQFRQAMQGKAAVEAKPKVSLE